MLQLAVELYIIAEGDEFLLYFNCIQAQVVSVTALAEQKDGTEIVHMEVEVAAKEKEDRK